MIIKHNMTALNGSRQYFKNVKDSQKMSEKLSSGYRINRSADDVAGLPISEEMRGQIRGMNRSSSNCSDAMSLIQTADGALEEMHSILDRLKNYLYNLPMILILTVTVKQYSMKLLVF